MAKKIGIDLGTTYSCVSYVDDMGTVRIIDNLEGEQTTPSVVYFDPNGQEAVVGSTARAEGAMNPECLVERVKNYMGDPDYKCYKNGMEYSAAAVSTLILKKLISDAEQYLGEEIEGAVITCPAYFGDSARNATKFAGENVVLSNGNNLPVFEIVDEPVAAAIAYVDSKKEDMQKTVLIYDLGGGTFDCTVIRMEIAGDKKKMQVITTGGNHQLGGKDWDNELAKLVRQKFCAATGADGSAMEDDAETTAWFSENIEKAKKNLTSREATTLAPSFDGQKERVEVTREEFESATSALLESTIMLVNDMMTQKGMSVAADIDEIILVGGSTFMPQVTKRLEQEYGKPLSMYEPNKAVAMGAAIKANGYEILTAAEAQERGIEVPQTTGGIGDGSLNAPIFAQKEDDVSGGGFETVTTCTKSYGIRIFSNGEEKVLNLVKKDTPKPASTSSATIMPNLTLTGTPDLVNSVNILILESDTLEDLVDRAICDEIYLEEPIQFDGEVPGNNRVSVEISVDQSGIVTLILTDEITHKTYIMNPKRKADEANQEGMASVKGMTLI